MLRHLIALLGTVLVLAGHWLVPSVLNAHEHDRQHLLVLNSYHSGLPWSQGLMRGMSSVFDDSGLPLVIHVEYLDGIRHRQDDIFPVIREYLGRKYEQVPLEVILTTDDVALDFLFLYREELFPGVPVVFCSPNDFTPQRLENQSLITGIAQNPDMRGTVELIRMLHPQAQTIAVVADRNPASMRVIQGLMHIEQEMDHPGLFTVLTDAGLEELLAELQALPSGTPVVFHAFLRDAAGRTYPSNLKNLKHLSGQSKLPFYTFKKIDIGHGAVGGAVISEELMAEIAADMAVQVLQGEPADAIPPVYDTPQVYLFDYEQIRKFGIKPDRLPEAAVIINRPLSLYHAHKEAFLTSGAALLLLLGLLGVLFIKNRRERQQRSRAEQDLQQSEARYRSIISVSNTGAWEFNRDTDRLWCSPEYFTMLGHDPADFAMPGTSSLEQVWISFLHPEDQAKAAAFFADYLRAGARGMYEQHFRMRHKDGHWVWIWSRGQTLLGDDKTPTSLTVGTHINITEIKLAYESLRESEEKLHALFSNMNEMVVLHELVMDEHDKPKDYRILDCNPAYYKVTGLQEGTVVGKTATQVYQAQEAPFLDVYSRVAVSGIPTEFCAYYAPMEKHFSISVVSPRKNTFATITSDISERVRSETEREKLQSQLLQAQKMESVGILAGGVAHDFNNLLHVMRGNIELLARNLSGDPQAAVRLDSVTKSLDRAARLVQQLLLFSRKAESGQERVDLNQEIRDAAAMLERTIPKMVSLELHLDPDIWSISGDPVQIEQVLFNLVNNSVDAMHEGGRLVIETGNVELDKDFVRLHPGAAAGPFVLLTVSDTGCGMDAATLKHVFDPFFTTKEVGQGTGLGLASVYGIVKSHGGYIRCYSEPGQGTTFRIYFPAVEGFGPGPEDAQNAVLQNERADDHGDQTILVVDDEREIRELTREVLEMLGYSVKTAVSGEQALEIYREHGQSIDLVLLDLNMPGMGGHRCLQELLRLNPEVRALIASGYSANGPARATLESGAVGFIGKPYQLKELVAAVRGALGLG